MSEYELLTSILSDSNFMFLSFFKNAAAFTIDHEQRTVTMEPVTWDLSNMNLVISNMENKLNLYKSEYPDAVYPEGSADLVTYLEEQIVTMKGYLVV
jgi:hypothetical protein